MEPENKFRQPLIIIGVTLILLVAISFVNAEYEIPILNFKIKNVDILNDIKEFQTDETQSFKKFNEGLAQSSYMIQSASMDLIKLLFSNDKISEFAIAANSLPLQGKKVSITGNTKQLGYFYDALKTAKTKIVRVAHYGDSGIEGDLITSDLREKMQSKFGGNGAGWLGITSQDITFRLTTKHSFSNNWESAALYSSNRNNLPLGISGEACVPKGNAWVQYEVTPIRRYLKDFSLVRLYYANAKSSSITYSFDNGTKQTATLKTGSAVQELILKPAGRAKSIRIEFPAPDQAYFYGVSLENEPGIYIDNLPLRGNTGVDLGSLQINLLKEFSRYLDYKLIILEFGLNIAGSRNTDYSWYEREMVKVINNLKSAFPKTSFLMVGCPDKSIKKGTSLSTDPTILKLIETQKNIAQKADIAFWSLFDAMGGENSMQTWVNANPPMAFKDYIHFNDQGAAKVASMLTDALLEFYK
jgi:lysophospholipase L1-like esterase